MKYISLEYELQSLNKSNSKKASDLRKVTMPVRHIKEHPARRVKTDSAKPWARKYTNIDEIRSSLRSQNQEELVEGMFLSITVVASFLNLYRSFNGIEESVIHKVG
jgi:hypothetical protein